MTRTRRMERAIARRFIKIALKQGYLISVDDGTDNDMVLKQSNDPKVILDAMFSVDDERLFLYRPGAKDEHWEGWVYFVYGNDGWDVICDYTGRLEPLMERVNKLSDKLCDMV